MENTERINKQAGTESEGMETKTGGMSMAAPAFQLMASTANPPVQRVAKSIKDFPIIQTGTSDSAIEATEEFMQFMDPSSQFQTVLSLTRDEARTACLMMVGAYHRGDDVDMAATGMAFAQRARARLNPQAGHGVIPRLGMEIIEVDQARAQQLFDQLAGLSFWNDQGESVPIPFHYPADGCYARAHLMSERLTALGYANKKQFAVAGMRSNSADLNVETEYGEDTPTGTPASVRWWYHVAPILSVRMPDNSLVEMVIDPSMFSNPVTVSAWTGRMNPKKFETLSVEEMRELIADDPLGYGVDKQLTYSTDRSNFLPHDVEYDTKDIDAHRSMNSFRGNLTNYATLEVVHEFVASYRQNSEVYSPKMIIAELSGWETLAKQHFMNTFKNLVAEMQARFTPQEWSLIIQELMRA